MKTLDFTCFAIVCSFGLISGRSGSGKTTLIQARLELLLLIWYSLSSILFFPMHLDVPDCSFWLDCPNLHQGRLSFRDMEMMENQFKLLKCYHQLGLALCFSFLRGMYCFLEEIISAQGFKYLPFLFNAKKSAYYQVLTFRLGFNKMKTISPVWLIGHSNCQIQKAMALVS